MAYSIIVMPAAQADLDEYSEYISRDSLRNAQSWLLKAWDVIFSLQEDPNRFAVISESVELRTELRAAIHYSH